MTNLKYSVETKNFDSFINKFEFTKPGINLKDLQQFSSQGIVTGDLDRAAMKVISKLGSWDIVYSGQISNSKSGYLLNGDLDFKAPDFVAFVNALNLDYSPKSYALGLFSLSGRLAGNSSIFKLTDMNAFVGANNFKGTLWVDKSGAKPNIVTELAITRFEPERFFYNKGTKAAGPANAAIALRQGGGTDEADFLARPFWDKTKLNYDFYKTFTLNGKFTVGDLIWKSYTFKNAELALEVKDDKIKLNSFTAGLNNGSINGQAELVLLKKPELALNFAVRDQEVDGSYWSGKVYGLRSWQFNAGGKLEMPAASVDEMITGARGEVSLDVFRPVVKGWDWLKLTDDLSRRDRSEGLANLARESLQSGETVFDTFKAKAVFNKGKITLGDAEFVSPKVKVSVEDESNLETWDMVSTYKVSLPELPKLPGFDFTLNGGMAAPELSVNVKPITDIYDAAVAKEEADKQAAEQARAEHLRHLMDIQQQQARQIKSQLEQEVIAEYDVRSAAAVSEEAKNQYATLKDEIDKTSSGIEEIFTLGLTQEFDESLPQALAKRNEVYGKKIPALKEQAAAIYVGDLKYQINDLYNQVIDIYNQSKEKSNAYRDKFVEFPKRLAKIKTDYNLDDDKLVNQLKQDIENYLLAIDGANSNTAKEYIAVQNSTDAEELEKFLEKIKTTKEDIIKDSGSLDESIKRLLDYTAESVGLEEQSYRERVKAAEMAKKVQENIGKISASTGKNKTIVRDIEDIEKSEKLKNEEPVKVLDFSKEKSYSGISKPGGTVKTENKPAAEKPAKEGIVRKASGSISKASGVVIKQ